MPQEIELIFESCFEPKQEFSKKTNKGITIQGKEYMIVSR